MTEPGSRPVKRRPAGWAAPAPLLALSLTLAILGCAEAGAHVQEGGREGSFPSLQELWARCRKTLPPFGYQVLKDEIVPSVTDPKQLLRRLDVRFTSLVIGPWDRRMDHPAVVFMPADPKINETPERRGKVVVLARPCGDAWMLHDYGDPIALRTGYPVMVIPIPGEYDGHDGESRWMEFFRARMLETRDPLDHSYFRLAIPYLRALDVFEGILKEKNLRAVIGGHSKRAPSAFNAAAIDPRVAGVVFMGMESRFAGYEGKPWQEISPIHSQEHVACPVLYLGATNEDGYEMFNVNRVQAKMARPWTLEVIPNFHHAAYSEIQILDWMMWISHVFDGRPLTRIHDLTLEVTAEGTVFRARIDSSNMIRAVKIWYVYCDDVPYWRDLMWYPAFMSPRNGTYEASVPGKLPDAWLVEVKDAANGFVGYVSSLPQDITGKPTRERSSRGWKSRNWEPKK